MLYAMNVNSYVIPSWVMINTIYLCIIVNHKQVRWKEEPYVGAILAGTASARAAAARRSRARTS